MTAAPPLASNPPPTKAWVGRQPIFDARRNIVAYELLYRNGPANRASFVDRDAACTQTLVTAFLDFGLDDLCGRRQRAWVNLTREVLLSPDVEALPKHRVVLEVLEDMKVDLRLEERLAELRKMGFRIALDDFRFDGNTGRLVEYADFVKLDLRALTRAELASHVRQLRATGVELLAEKVESEEEMEVCERFGFDFFQGYHLHLPEVRTTKRTPESKSGALRLLALVQDPQTKMADLEQALITNVGLTYRILRFLNSSLFARSHRIDSVPHALVMLGRDRLSKWVSLMVLAGLDDTMPACLVEAVVRGRMSELLGEELCLESPSAHFAAGLFSLLDRFLVMPMEQIVASLPLGPDLEGALLRREGAIGQVLAAVEAYEAGRWEGLELEDLPPDRFPDAYRAAVQWAEEHLHFAKAGK
jgi:EAL and modified HD-GYP domain-containing signal transduction protein